MLRRLSSVPMTRFQSNKLIVLISITVIIFFGFWYYGNYNNSNTNTIIHHYKKDSVYYQKRDSLHKINDTTSVKIQLIERTYEKKIETIKRMPIDSAYIFWADYIQRYRINNDSATAENY